MISYSVKCAQRETAVPAQVTVKSGESLLFKATDQLTVSGDLTWTNSLHLPVPSGAEVCVTADETTACAVVSLLPNSPPEAAFDTHCVELTCTFTDKSTDPDGSIDGRTWDFADGGVSSDQSPSHSYSASGTYVVELTVTDDRGATHSTTRSVTVNASPTASFDTSCVDLTCAFTDNSVDSDGSIVAWAWDFNGDGTIESAEKAPSHSYSAAGTYDVILTVTDDGGAEDSTTQSITVAYAPLTIDTASLPAAKKKTAYSTQLQASGGKPDYSWSVISGSLPPGLSLSPDGTLGGTPKIPGSYSFTAQVVDQQEPSKSASRGFTIQIAPR